MLSDNDILKEVRASNIIIDPFNTDYLQPASYDVHLDDTILVPKHLSNGARFDPAVEKQPLENQRIYPRTHEYEYLLSPGATALGCTKEVLTLAPMSLLAADIAGCSSLGRWFLFVHVTAGFVDPGWSGRLTLELYNASPWWIRIWAGMRIAQLRFYTMPTKPIRNYLDIGHYAGATTVLPANYTSST